MVFDHLFGRKKRKKADPQISFGRYSDNNKSVEKVQRWNDADELFRENKFWESTQAFFDYLCDEEQKNVVLRDKRGHRGFLVYQGSKVIRGKIGKDRICAEIKLVRMPEPSIPVMRRLLEMNFHLYYSRYALKGDTLCVRFESDLIAATPNKLYYGLKEMATKADKQDDLLLDEFGFLEPVDTANVSVVPENEKETKFNFLQSSIRSCLTLVDSLDPEKFAGGISYLLLTLAFRIDYLIAPEGKILNDLEKIASTYYKKDDKSPSERNPVMIEKFRSLLQKPKEEIYSRLFHARYTFTIVVPQKLPVVMEAIETALQNMEWYRDNDYYEVANKVMEYGFAYCQYSYSLPRPLSELFHLYMQINYADYFLELGFQTSYYDEPKNQFAETDIREKIDDIVSRWKHKYTGLAFKTKKLKFDTLLNFNQSFLQEVTTLNFE